MTQFFLAAVIVLSGLARANLPSSLAPRPATSLIREEQQVMVNGNREFWRLQWKSPPKPACAPEDGEDSITCPCSGFAYGESGELDLVRVLNDREIDRLELSSFFEGTGVSEGAAILRRWEFNSKDLDEYNRDGFAERVRARPIATIMRFKDYNHDGKSTEFFLQTEAGPCGKTGGIVVGVTPSSPHLHAFATVAHLKKPLTMHEWEWEALLKAKVPTEVADWPCGDHGSETQTFLTLHAKNGAIHVILREFECRGNDKRGRLIRKESL